MEIFLPYLVEATDQIDIQALGMTSTKPQALNNKRNNEEIPHKKRKMGKNPTKTRNFLPW